MKRVCPISVIIPSYNRHQSLKNTIDSLISGDAIPNEILIVDQSTTLSNRSIAGVAADGTLYATVNPSTPKKRSDGRTLEATNGFVGMMQGWEWVNVDDATKPNPRIESKACEWVYFGTLHGISCSVVERPSHL